MIQYTVKVYDNKTEWFNEENQLHRLDGPAFECANGDKSWYKEGKRHREDGPALERPDGSKYWYLNGNQVTEDAVMNPVKELTMAQLEELLGHKVKVIK